jgi:DUF971 family protein
MRPKKISRSGPQRLAIVWEDDTRSEFTYQRLRDSCPCATCNAARESETSILPIYEEGKYDLKSVKQVGSYAVQLVWQDGHDTGIFTYEFLRNLTRQPT